MGDADFRVGHHPEPTPMGVIHITYDYLRRSGLRNRGHMASAEGTSAPPERVTVIPMRRRVPRAGP